MVKALSTEVPYRGEGDAADENIIKAMVEVGMPDKPIDRQMIMTPSSCHTTYK